MSARAGLTAEQIDRVTARFYAKVQSHDVLGPIFAVHVTDWDAHITKIQGFWRNAILQTREYSGNPLQKHRAAGNVAPENFEDWLALFDETLAEELPPNLARAWSDLAHRIGQSLRFGMSMTRPETGGVPNLRSA